ncbi:MULTISPECIES: BrnT family toxin [Nguyenibacter]|uniref:BrnT family toxin n=1 Tax=Nguyenibacter vanlangensis TaxID=1216886 RepID=A0ABZ3D5A6_9PROT|nr:MULTISPECIES: BrnT family toxin [Nguyenibacter]WRH87647.1 BrnT family toxin [Nguyenibacter sp. L1]
MLAITWDEPKRLKTLNERGLDFADLKASFFLSSIVVPAKNDRLMAIGPFLDGTIAVVFAELGTQRPDSKIRKRILESKGHWNQYFSGLLIREILIRISRAGH